MAAPDGSVKRQAGRNSAEKAKLLVEYAQLPADKGGWKVGAGALCAGAAQLLVVHAQLLVGMPIRVFSLCEL